ncbi:MAG TPA: DNA translocase FtsK 4TM domain-containing protein [Candidatus Methylomirabilis sp.]|nr:DNA translocase FtsK 4TM domain-containing protein [Candidatus Methylomirabilis sp.]
MSPRRKKPFKLDLSLNPETQKGVFTVFLFFAAVLILLSLFGLAGRFGEAVDAAVSQVFGWDKIAVPFFLFAWGYALMAPEKMPLKATNFIGFALFFISLNGLVHAVTFPAPGGKIDVEALRAAGGKLGQLIAEPGAALFGFAGAVSLFAALFVVSWLLIFNTTLQSIVRFFQLLWRGIVRILRFLSAPFVWLLKRRQSSFERRQSVAETAADEEPEESIDEPEEEDAQALPVRSLEEGEDAAPPPPKPRRRRGKVEIPLDLLLRRDQRPVSGDIELRQGVIRKTLANFGISVEMADVSVGPTVTQFTLKPSEGIKLSRITALHNDLALALAAHPIRIEAPIPGKPFVGLEVPNQSIATVGLREMLETREFKERKSPLSFVLGKDVTGGPWVAELGKMPHLLVAGATGSGKSVCLNILIMSLLYANGPDDLKLILVDPKRVEFPVYNNIPHLLTPVITNVENTVNALKWTLREMDRRFDVLSKFGARDLATYNQRSEDKMPYLVFVVDELADLMVTSQAEVEGPIVRLSQMARAVGIHLVLATQRPSVDVLTGLIKANIPARAAFAVASATDSRTILDQMGAEKLLGRGDMLFQSSDMPSPKRIQGAFVTDDEVRHVVEFLTGKYGPPDYESAVIEKRGTGGTAFSGGTPIDDGDSDALLPEAKEEILRAGKASASLLQRRLKVGYARAARLLDLLEQEGFIGPGDGAKPREILKAEFTKGMDQVPVRSRQSDVGSGQSDDDLEERARLAEIDELARTQDDDEL